MHIVIGRLRQTVRWCNRTQSILMDDNARPHRARVVEKYLQQNIVRMDWAACSPDLYPIEHVWNMLQVAISRRPVQPTTLVELGNALTEEWNNIEMAAIQETHWKHETPLPVCDRITLVTHKLLTVVAASLCSIILPTPSKPSTRGQRDGQDPVEPLARDGPTFSANISNSWRQHWQRLQTSPSPEPAGCQPFCMCRPYALVARVLVSE